jgi:hypothetical protein
MLNSRLPFSLELISVDTRLVDLIYPIDGISIKNSEGREKIVGKPKVRDSA